MTLTSCSKEQLLRFLTFLHERDGSIHLMCWLDLEDYKLISKGNVQERHLRKVEISDRYLGKKYFFGSESPISKWEQYKLTLLIGGPDEVNWDDINDHVFKKIQTNVSDYLEVYWLPMFLEQDMRIAKRRETMPFLHGFRRIDLEYQPLVDAVLCVVELEEGPSQEERENTPEDSLCSSLVELLEREAQLDFFEEAISYALFKVAERGLVCPAEILLRYGADVNFEDPVRYYKPLHIAVLNNRPSIVKLLVEHGADIEKRDRVHESSPLDLSSEESERLPCMLALLDLGAEVNARDKNGKTALLHALALSSVNNIENIQLLLQRGADIHAVTVDGETAESSLVFVIKEALKANAEDAAECGKFCLRATQLLLAHGADPSRCLNEDGEPSLTQTSLEYFDMLFPLAVLLLQRGASFVCTHHGESCWSGYTLIFHRLKVVLHWFTDTNYISELFEKAEILLDLARISSPSLPLPPRVMLPLPGQPHAQACLDLHKRVVEEQASPPTLRCLCRAFLRSHLQPWPIEDRVKALPLPDRLKHFILSKDTYSPKPGWECFRPEFSQF